MTCKVRFELLLILCTCIGIGSLYSCQSRGVLAAEQQQQQQNSSSSRAGSLICLGYHALPYLHSERVEAEWLQPYDMQGKVVFARAAAGARMFAREGVDLDA
jgi:hypothetical protein